MNIKFLYLPACVFFFANASMAMDNKVESFREFKFKHSSYLSKAITGYEYSIPKMTIILLCADFKAYEKGEISTTYQKYMKVKKVTSETETGLNRQDFKAKQKFYVKRDREDPYAFKKTPTKKLMEAAYQRSLKGEDFQDLFNEYIEIKKKDFKK